MAEAPALFIIAGLSGAGKSTALRVYEDLGYFAVDGLPAAAMPQVAAIMLTKSMSHFPGMAIGMDTRTDNFFSDFKAAWENIKATGFSPCLIFLEAADKSLFQRYATTRRPHPLEGKKPGLSAAIDLERELLAPLRDMANQIIDSSNFSIHDLRRRIQKSLLPDEGHFLKVKIVSFGFKRGLPPDADFVFDLRFLVNPYFVTNLRPLSGLDLPVSEFIFGQPEAMEFRDKLTSLLLFALKRMEAEGRYRVTIAFGCTGGRHRSVAMAEAIMKSLRQAGFMAIMEHRDINQDVSPGDLS